MTTDSADYCKVCLLRLEVDVGSVLKPELGQKQRYGVRMACTC